MRKYVHLFFVLASFLGFSQEIQNDVTVLQVEISEFEKSGDTLNIQYSNLLNDLGDLYYDQEKYLKAETLFKKSLSINKKTVGETHPEYLKSLTNLAILYFFQERYNKSELLFLKSLELNETYLEEENNQDYTDLINIVVFSYTSQGKNLEAEKIHLRRVEILRKNEGEEHPNYLSSLNTLARFYIDQGKYEEAEYLLLNVLEKRKKILGENHGDYVTTLNDLAVLYDEEGKYELAEPIFLKVLESCKEIFGVKHNNYASVLNSLGQFYKTQGEYPKAEPLMLESSEIRKENSGEKSIDYSISLASLGGLYLSQGKYDEAEPLYLKSLEINKEILGEKHPYYAAALNNLALLYNDQGKFKEAENFYIKSLEIKKETLGETHPDYAVSLNNLAINLLNQGKYSEAEPLCLKALEIKKETLGETHADYASSLNTLAHLYNYQGKYSKAEFLFLNAIDIIDKTLGKNHPNYISSVNNLAELYRTMGLNEKASIYFEQFIKVQQKRVIDYTPILTEKELIAFINLKKEELYSPFSFLNDFPTQYPEICVGSFENELLLKNLSLRNQELLKKSIQKSGNKSIQDKYLKLLRNKREINKLKELSMSEYPDSFDALISATEQLEKELVNESASFLNFKKAILTNLNDIKNKLKSNEVAIDLVSFIYYKKKLTDSIVYAAFVVGKDFKAPRFIPLFEQKQLEFLLAMNETQPDRIRIAKQYFDKFISDLFLKPLEKELQGVTTIYLSPSGLGHQIDFAALPISESQTLGEKYKVHILSSPAEIVDYKVSSLDKKSNIELLLYGGIDYDKSNAKTEIKKEIIEVSDDLANLVTRSGIKNYGYLKGTDYEVEQIKLKGVENGFTSNIFNGREATEESIKKLDGRVSPFVLHMATHGFFFPDPEKEYTADILLEQGKSKIYKTADDPMMRSGLLFAGANNYWRKPNENNNSDDGILTASEISNLDLSACKLVVLSACETGLGEINGSEGVFGLQRAFKMAGVKNIIMSLWKVPDAQTAELFDIFYGECFTGKSIHEAFQIAQSKMKVKYSPYYWAGFVLLE
jgi:CHAT domain-containing protein/Tfp pilus assembly protein PilF